VDHRDHQFDAMFLTGLAVIMKLLWRTNMLLRKHSEVIQMRV